MPGCGGAGDTSMGALPALPALVPQSPLGAGKVRATSGATRQDVGLCKLPASRSRVVMCRQVG